MLLTDKAARYYWDIHNPIIPGLAENWADVDRLFEIANKATIKSIESMKDTLARLTALAEFMEKYAKLAPYFIYKKNIIDNMKESFAKNVSSMDSARVRLSKARAFLAESAFKSFSRSKASPMSALE